MIPGDIDLYRTLTISAHAKNVVLPLPPKIEIYSIWMVAFDPAEIPEAVSGRE